MRHSFLVCFLLLKLVSSVSIGRISRARFRFENLSSSSSSMLFNRTCDECLCWALNANEDLVGLNCFLDANRCEFFNESSTLINDSNATVLLLRSPPPISSSSPIYVGSSSLLFEIWTFVGFSSYSCRTYRWTSNITGVVTLSFELRHDPGYWFLDAVSVLRERTDEMLVNGGFETGSLSPWGPSLS